MEVNDEVFMLQGVPAPMVLRRTEGENTFSIIGPALVHGLMFHEAGDTGGELIAIV